jgi:hypothetical protein
VSFPTAFLWRHAADRTHGSDGTALDESAGVRYQIREVLLNGGEFVLKLFDSMLSATSSQRHDV